MARVPVAKGFAEVIEMVATDPRVGRDDVRTGNRGPGPALPPSTETCAVASRLRADRSAAKPTPE